MLLHPGAAKCQHLEPTGNSRRRVQGEGLWSLLGRCVSVCIPYVSLKSWCTQSHVSSLRPNRTDDRVPTRGRVSLGGGPSMALWNRPGYLGKKRLLAPTLLLLTQSIPPTPRKRPGKDVCHLLFRHFQEWQGRVCILGAGGPAGAGDL